MEHKPVSFYLYFSIMMLLAIITAASGEIAASVVCLTTAAILDVLYGIYKRA